MFPCTLGRHSALTASLLWATVGAKYMSTCQTETSISGAVMLVYSREMRGESPGDLRENKHFSHSRFTKTHLRPLNTTREIFYHLFEAHVRKKKTPLSAYEAMQKVRVKLTWWVKASSSLPLERTRVKHLHHWSISALRIHSLKISSSIPKIKAAAGKPARITSLSIHTLVDTCKKSEGFQTRPHEPCFGGASQLLAPAPTWRGLGFGQKPSLIITVRCRAALSLLWKQWGSLFIWMHHRPKTHKYPWQRCRLTNQSAEQEQQRQREGRSVLCNGNARSKHPHEGVHEHNLSLSHIPYAGYYCHLP